MTFNKNLHSKNELTEFSREFEDSKENVLSKIVNKIYETCNNTYSQNEEYPQPAVLPEDENKPNCSSSAMTESASSEAQDEFTERPLIEYKVDISLGRTPSNVLKRLSNLVAFKNNNLENYKDTDFQKLWMPDNKSRECYDCEAKFSTFRRKHHCRLCGQIFCSRCCNQNIPGKILNVTGELRVCNYCSKVILTYLKSSDINADLKSDLQSLEENLSSKFVSSSSSLVLPVEVESPSRRKVSIGYQEERLITNPINTLSNADRRNILQQSNTLKTLYEEMIKHLKHHQIKGGDLINFLMNSQKFTTRQQAIEVISAMIEAGFIVSNYSELNSCQDQVELEQQIIFNEAFFYRLENVEMLSTSAISSDMPFQKESDNEYQFFPKESDEKDLHATIFSTTAAKPFLESYCDHEEQLLNQLLQKYALEQSWSKTLINLCARISHTIQPNIDSMDIRHYTKIKKISGGSRSECQIITGIAFSKNVVHKDMKTSIDSARILLIQCPIQFQRVEGKFVTLEALLLQEREYLRNVVSRILSYSPDIVLVHKNVSGIAQDMLRNSGITLVLDVKLSVFEKLSHCLECDIVTSIDSNIGKPKLGICKRFYTKNFLDANSCTKTLMIFDIPNSQRGCSLIIRGGSSIELTKVKEVASFLLYARYNFRLELCFLLDVFAQPPGRDQQIFPNDESSKKPSQMTSFNQIDRNDLKKLSLENVMTFSDPLRCVSTLKDGDRGSDCSLLSTDESSFKFKIKSSILSISPFMSYPPPYLETDSGMRCYLRNFFPKDLFSTKKATMKSKNSTGSNKNYHIGETAENLAESYSHEFLCLKISQMIDNKNIQTSIADFRRYVGKYPKVKTMQKITKPQKASEKAITAVIPKKNEIDVFDIYHHQRLPVLFCSFYYDTSHMPTSFCAEPLLLFMNFYGQDDIMLGLFLERYCFRSSYICSSCKLPMMNHVRKYANSKGVVTVKITEDQIKNENSNIKVSSRCKICNTMTPKVNLNRDSWCFSFAKFLELKFHGHSYTKSVDCQSSKIPCKHSIHRDHVQYFSSNGLIVSFSYSEADIFEIKFPPFTTTLKVPILPEKRILEENFKSFSTKGYDVFVKIHEKLANLSSETETPMIASLKKVLHKNQLYFKRRVEVVYTLLSTYSPDMSPFEINDAILLAQKELADCIELWGPKLNEAEVKVKISQKHEIFQGFEEFDDKDDDIDFDAEVHSKIASEESNQNDKKEKIDKNSIKKLLSSLLPSNSDQNTLPTPFSQQEHFLTPGQFPILVNDSDISSLIAYTLMSHDYKKKIEFQFNEQLLEANTSNSLTSHQQKKAPKESKIENDEKDSKESTDKKKLSNNHIEVSVHDSTTQFSCKMYFARQFDELRSKCMETPKNTSHNSPSFSRKCDEVRQFFARSLSQSKKWEARGGKSGSKFNKTVDDCFILKEMSKHDIGEFEKFAYNYFEYVDNCIQKNQLTLLAKIFGVYKIVIKKKDSVVEKSVLVMENLFCDKKIKNKYDLKGSERNRLVQTNSDSEETVLLDENFVKASWNKPLYILSHSRTILKEVIHRDSSFLEKNQVMDYSLLVGVDEKFLIVGIIDYIRKFTIDKRIESYLKQVVDQRLPTVVNPSVYKNRFMEAMNRYFLAIPDRWEGLSEF